MDTGRELLDVSDISARSLKGNGILLMFEDLRNVLELLEGREVYMKVLVTHVCNSQHRIHTGLQ